MMRFLKQRTAAWARNEDGNASVEFVIVVPVFIAMMIMSIELGYVTLRQTMLERGLDIAVRDIRLSTSSSPQHSEIKQTICDEAMIIPNCSSNLRLEMISADPRNFAGINPVPDCVDLSQPAKPLRAFENGQSNELMILRACAIYDPIFPEDMLGEKLIKASNGQPAFVSMSAFVQEPS